MKLPQRFTKKNVIFLEVKTNFRYTLKNDDFILHEEIQQLNNFLMNLLVKKIFCSVLNRFKKKFELNFANLAGSCKLTAGDKYRYFIVYNNDLEPTDK